MAQIGEIRVASAEPYERTGFIIEQFDGDHWSIPAWEERGCADFAQTFETRDEAERAITANT